VKRIRAWLKRVPGRDVIERRQAYLLQIVLFAIAITLVIGTIGNAISMATRAATDLPILPNLVAAAIVLVLIAILRRGRFRLVAGLTIAFLVYGFANSLVAATQPRAGSYLALLLLPIVLAGLVLPRVGLLLTTAAVLGSGLLAIRVHAEAAPPGIAESTGNFVFAAVLVAVVIDRFGGTLREALLRALSREQQLETAQGQLQERSAELQTAVAALEAEIAERERLEEERVAMERRVLEVQKLESLGVLAGGIAHDFNNLLVGIMGNAGLALLELPPESAGRERVAQIETAARRASDLAREMLAYSGKGRFIVAPLDLSELVREMTHLLKVSIGKSVVLKYNLERRPTVVEGDATQLRQVVMNLVVNASDAIGDDHGVITLATGRLVADRHYLAGTYLDEGLSEGEYVFVEVSDTGAGMDEATIARIFDPFFTTKFAGRGLGLAAVLGIVRGHHGALKVYSEPGRGSTFKLLLPTSAATVEAEPASGPLDAAWQGTGTVLVVDDEPLVRDVATAMLGRMGLDVVVASDGAEAVERFTADPARFRLVLLDLTMPRLSGAEVFRQIRAVRPETPVIMMSGYNEEEASGEFAGKGLAGFIEKPFTPQTLATAVRRVVEPG
jgi:signal transduction histidine kinase